MEELRSLIGRARQAFGRFQELAHIEAPTAIERDAAIQRFEFTCEIVWKATLKAAEHEGLRAASPRASIRYARSMGWLSDADAQHALEMVEDRNRTVHTYAEPVAIFIFGRLPGHADVLGRWISSLSKHVEENAG
ncbi:nucleotidyltransferase substrate binding protein [Inquilinus sp. CAU 1745]|uniref:nucleotidyltransferase substrate binding protein n=1 Tax=Inquilinus sp. CAU 1745 TaxID=3140369 RepID=UPI00325B904D